MESRVSIRSTIPQQLPQFIEEDHPLFSAFVSAYFEYLERSGGPISFVRDALDYVDPSETLDSFITHFFEEMRDIPNNILADKSLLAQHIIQLYQSKGTIKGYEFLFRIMYDEDVTVYLPKFDLLRPSDGKWERSIVIRVKASIGNPFDCIGKEIQQKDEMGIVVSRSRIENVLYREDILVYDLHLSQNTIFGDFSQDTITCGDVVMTLERSPTIFSTGRRGSGYRPGDIVRTFGNQGLKAIVSEVKGGPISKVIIIDGGFGYSIGDQLNVQSTSGTGADIRVSGVSTGGVITGVNIVDGGQGYLEFVNIDTSDRGVLVCVGDRIGEVLSFKIRDPGCGVCSPPTCSLDTTAIVSDVVGAFVIGEPITVASSSMMLETNYDLIQEDGSNINVEYQETGSTDYAIRSIGDNRSIIGGFHSVMEFQTEAEDGIILSEDSSRLLGEVSNIGLNRRTIVGSNSGASARILYINPADIDSTSQSIYDAGSRFANDDGKVSEVTKKIQDSRYYQEYSYVIRSGNSIREYRNAIYKLMHPAGTIMFGSIDIETKSDLIVSTVGTFANVVAKILEIYATQSIGSHNELLIEWHSKSYAELLRDYRWIERNKFGFGPYPGTIVGVDLKWLSSMRDVQSIPDHVSNYNTNMTVLENVTFDDFYQYDLADMLYVAPGYWSSGYSDPDSYRPKRTRINTTWESQIDSVYGVQTADGYLLLDADGSIFLPAESDPAALA